MCNHILKNSLKHIFKAYAVGPMTEHIILKLQILLGPYGSKITWLMHCLTLILVGFGGQVNLLKQLSKSHVYIHFPFWLS